MAQTEEENSSDTIAYLWGVAGSSVGGVEGAGGEELSAAAGGRVWGWGLGFRA